MFSPSKRFRPVLTTLTAEACGCDPRYALPTACAIEYIHTYSLIHDDLPELDNGQLRRGKPTCHLAFGQDVALLAGDALFAEAFALIAREQPGTAEQKLKVILEIAQASGVNGMVGGQIVDVQAAKDVRSSSFNKHEELLNFMHQHKTGALIKAAAVCGAILAGASDATITKISRYGSYLGLAFQVVDDILDDVGDIQTMGKTKGRDKELNKLTFVQLFGLNQARKKAEQAVKKAVEALATANIKSERLESLAYFVLEREK